MNAKQRAWLYGVIAGSMLISLNTAATASHIAGLTFGAVIVTVAAVVLGLYALSD